MADRRELCVGGKPISSLRVVDLKAELEKRSLPKSGSKKELLERLRLHLQLEETREAALKDEDHVPNLSLCNETENDFVREYLAAQQARFQVQKEAKKQYEEKVRESEASAEETTQDEDEPSDYSPARKVSPKKSTRAKRKEELTSTPIANKEVSKFQTPESVSTLREEETPSQDDDTTEEEEARTPRTRKHKLLKYVQAPKGAGERGHQAGNSVTGQGHVEQLHAGRRRDPPPSQLYGDAAGAKDSQSPAPAGSSSKASTSAESSESENVLPRVVDVWSEKENKTEVKPSVPEPAPEQEEKPKAEIDEQSEEPKVEAKAAEVEEPKSERVKDPTEEIPAEKATEVEETKPEQVEVPKEETSTEKPAEKLKSEQVEAPKEEIAAEKPSDEPTPIVAVEPEPKEPEIDEMYDDSPPELTKLEPDEVEETPEDHANQRTESLPVEEKAEEIPEIVRDQAAETTESLPVKGEEEERTPEPTKDHADETTESLPVKKEDDEAMATEQKDDTPVEISMEESQENPEEKVAPETPAERADEEMKQVQTVQVAEKNDEPTDAKSEERASEIKEMQVEEPKEERAPTPAPVEDVLTIEAEPEPLDQPENKDSSAENGGEKSAEIIMAIEKEKSPEAKAKSESREEVKAEPSNESAQLASDNEEDELQVDASELIDDSLRITAADETEDKQPSSSSSESRSESRQSIEVKGETKEKQASPVKTEEQRESPEPVKHEPVRKLKIKKSQPQPEQSAETTENGGLRKRRWGTSSLLPNKKPAMVISTESLKAIVPDAKPLSAEEVRLGSPHFQSAKQTTAPAAGEDEEPKTEKPEPVRRVAVEVAEAIAPAKPEAVIAAAAPLLEATSPAQQPRNCVLQLSNLVRPFTVNQLKDLLARTGHLVDGKFWIDKVKSTCLVQYETEDEAEETRSALHGIHWPTSNPKTLIVDFSTVEQLENRLAGKDVPSGPVAKAEPRPAPAPAPADESKRERPERVREWDLGKVSEPDADRFQAKENRTGDDEKATGEVVKAKDDVPAKLLDDLFRKTKAAPCIYWLPLTDAQIGEKEEMRRQRIAERNAEREKRERETKQRRDEAFAERQREREKQREGERERQRAREQQRQRPRKRSHSSSSGSSSRSSSPSPAKRRASKSPPPPPRRR